MNVDLTLIYIHYAVLLGSRRGYPTGQVCRSCAAGCTSCGKNATHCLSCDEPLLLHEHQCVEECPPSHTVQDGKCRPCPSACLECHPLGQCTGTKTQCVIFGFKCVCPLLFPPLWSQLKYLNACRMGWILWIFFALNHDTQITYRNEFCDPLTLPQAQHFCFLIKYLTTIQQIAMTALSPTGWIVISVMTGEPLTFHLMPHLINTCKVQPTPTASAVLCV